MVWYAWKNYSFNERYDFKFTFSHLHTSLGIFLVATELNTEMNIELPNPKFNFEPSHLRQQTKCNKSAIRPWFCRSVHFPSENIFEFRSQN